MTELSNDAFHAFAMCDIAEERQRQEDLWGRQDWPSAYTPAGIAVQSESLLRNLCKAATADGTCTWEHIAAEEFAEAVAAPNDMRRREELVQLAAVVVAWIECIDRRAAKVKIADREV